MIFWIALILLLWIISIIFNDIEDSLAHHYKDSVFDWLPKHTWLSRYMQDSDETWKRKYVWLPAGRDGEVNVGRKKFFGIIIPAFFFDGRHGAKIIKQFFQYLTIFVAILNVIIVSFATAILLFTIVLLLFGINNYMEIYSKLFFGRMFLKKWWE
jgi:hypothetical protein